MLSLDYREQLDSLTALKWPTLICQSVPWAAHEHLCFLHRWSHVGSSLNQDGSLSRVDVEQDHDAFDANMAGRASSSKEEGIMTEDGELPSLTPATVVTDEKSSAYLNQGSGVKHSKRMALISKSIAVPVKTARNQSFGRYEEDTDLMMDSESEVDDTTNNDKEIECAVDEGNSWVDYGIKEFNLVLTRKRDAGEGNVDLEVKVVKIFRTCDVRVFSYVFFWLILLTNCL